MWPYAPLSSVLERNLLGLAPLQVRWTKDSCLGLTTIGDGVIWTSSGCSVTELAVDRNTTKSAGNI